MKVTSATPLTAALVVVLLTGAGICIGMRQTADRQRSAAGNEVRGSTGSTAPAVETQRNREPVISEMAGSRVSNRTAMHERLSRLWVSGSNLERNRGLLEAMDALNPADFPAFFEELKKVVDGNTQILILALSAWGEVDPAAALQREIEVVGESPYPSAVLKVWAERDPVAALDWLTSNGKSGKPVDEVLKTFAAEDPAGALAWAKEHDDPKPIDGIPHRRLMAALQGMMPERLDEAIRSFSALPQDTRGSLLFWVSSQAGSLDAAGRRQWLESLNGDDERNAAAAAMIDGMKSMVSVKDRLELVAEYPAALEQPGADSLFRRWMEEDSKTALQTLEQIPVGKARDTAVKTSIEGLVQAGDAKESLELMNHNPQVVDEKTLTLWFGMAATNAHEWELAISQLPRVSSEAFREQTYQEIMESWLFSDRNTARAWLDSHDDVPENVRKALELR